MNWYIKVLKNYASFKGRARRKEYWYFYLINIIISIILPQIDKLIHLERTLPLTGFENEKIGALSLFYMFFILIPSLAVQVRRLHDINKSGWWVFIALIPLLGTVILFVMLAEPGNIGANQYGEDPINSEQKNNENEKKSQQSKKEKPKNEDPGDQGPNIS